MDHKTIGNYEVVRLIGEGGMGRVFLARDPMLDRRVAVKVLSSPSPLGEEVARFEREGRALAALDHPNILSIHEFGRIGTMPYVVMELLDGKNLREMLAGGPMPHKTVLGYAIEIAHGLAAAHEKGIAHRDLKPENIFVTNGGRVKIVDFGLANVRVHEQTSTRDLVSALQNVMPQSFELAFEQRDPLLIAATTWPLLLPVRRDPRVVRLLGQMGIA